METEILLANNTTVGGSGETAPAASQTSSSTVQPAGAPEAVPSMFGSNAMLLLTMVGVFAIMYIFTIRPQKKREKELKAIQDSIKSGDWILTFSGLYGKVVDVGPTIAIVEFGTNKGVRIPIRKTEITKSEEPVLFPKEEEETDKKGDKK